MANNIDRQYLELVNHILRFGYDKKDRTGTGTKSIYGWQIRHSMKEGFPLLTTKKMAFKTMVTELLFFLRGETNLRFLVDRNCHIWDGDAYKNYLKYTVIGVNAGLDILKGYLDNCLVEFEGYYEHFTNPSFQYGYRPLTQEEFINKIKTDDGFAKKFGDLGPIYGAQWRGRLKGYGFNEITGHPLGYSIDPKLDQIAEVINLLKTDPDSRRMIVNSWNVGELDQMVLPPCHMMFQFYTRELSWYDDLDKIKETYVDWSLSKPSGGYAGDIKADTIESANQIFVNGWQKYKDPFTGKPLIELECFSSIPKRAISLMFNMRSNDVPLGLPFNLASYGLLLEILAKRVNMVPDELITNIGDAHIYLNQIEGVKEQLTRIPYELPTVKISDRIVNDISEYEIEDFILENYKYHPSIKIPLSN